MTFQVVVYFSGPQTQWAGKVSDLEVIARYELPFLWAAKVRGRQLLAELNTSRCGCVVMHKGSVLHHWKPYQT